MGDADFDCRACGGPFVCRRYFWDHVGQSVRCPHCGAAWETDWDEGDDGVIGPWLYKVAPADELGVACEPR